MWKEVGFKAVRRDEREIYVRDMTQEIKVLKMRKVNILYKYWCYPDPRFKGLFSEDDSRALSIYFD